MLIVLEVVSTQYVLELVINDFTMGKSLFHQVLDCIGFIILNLYTFRSTQLLIRRRRYNPVINLMLAELSFYFRLKLDLGGHRLMQWLETSWVRIISDVRWSLASFPLHFLCTLWSNWPAIDWVCAWFAKWLCLCALQIIACLQGRVFYCCLLIS